MKTKLKGFTLVELIVVMALMGIIMAGAFAILSPTANMTARITSAKDEETIAFQVGRSMSSVLSYATDVYVYATDSGAEVPKADKKYKYVYIINNSDARSSSVKGAKGMVTRGKWDGTDIKDVVEPIQSAVYGEDEVKIRIAEYGQISEKSNYIMLSFVCCPMIPESDHYIPNEEQLYKYNESIHFVNINNKTQLEGGDSYSLKIDSSVDTKSDMYYIFFVPATETELKTSSSSTSESEASSAESSETSEELKEVTVTFVNDIVHTNELVTLNNQSAISSQLPAFSDPTLNDQSVDKYYSGWVNSTGYDATALKFNDISSGQTFTLKQEDKVKVEFLDYDKSTVKATRYVVPSTTEAQTVDAPDPGEPSNSEWEFDCYKNLSTEAVLGTEKLSSSSGYKYYPAMKKKPTEEELAKQATVNINFLNNYKGEFTFDIKSDYTLDGGDTKTNSYTAAYNVTEGDKKVVFIKDITKDYICKMTMLYNTSYEFSKSEYVVFKKGDLTSGENNVYVYFDNSNYPTFSKVYPNPNRTKITLHIKTDPKDNILDFTGPGGIQYRGEFVYDGSTKLSLPGSNGISLNATKDKDIKLTLRSDIRVQAGTTAVKDIENDGIDKEYYLCDTPIGNKWMTEPLGTYSKITVNFIDKCPNSSGMGIFAGMGNEKFIWIKGSGSSTAIPSTTEAITPFSFGGETGNINGQAVFYVFGQVLLTNGLPDGDPNQKFITTSNGDDFVYNYTDANGFVPYNNEFSYEIDTGNTGGLADYYDWQDGGKYYPMYKYSVKIIKDNDSAVNVPAGTKVTITFNHPFDAAEVTNWNNNWNYEVSGNKIIYTLMADANNKPNCSSQIKTKDVLIPEADAKTYYEILSIDIK